MNRSRTLHCDCDCDYDCYCVLTAHSPVREESACPSASCPWGPGRGRSTSIRPPPTPPLGPRTHLRQEEEAKPPMVCQDSKYCQICKKLLSSSFSPSTAAAAATATATAGEAAATPPRPGGGRTFPRHLSRQDPSAGGAQPSPPSPSPPPLTLSSHKSRNRGEEGACGMAAADGEDVDVGN